MAHGTAYETPYYTDARSFKVVTIPLTGHDVALHFSSLASFAVINNWIRHTPG